MTRPSFWYRFVPVFVPMGEESRHCAQFIAPISVPIQILHQAQKPYTLLIYQGVWGIGRVKSLGVLLLTPRR